MIVKSAITSSVILLLGILPTWAEVDWKKAEKQYDEVVRIALRYPAQTFAKAAESGDINTVRRLLDSGVPVSLRIPDESGYTGIPPWAPVIHHAASGGQLEVVRLLLDRGASPRARSSDGSTPLHWTSSPEVAKLLLDHGADASARNDDNEQPIHHAASCESLTLVRLLIQHGADPLAKDVYGTQPIHNAVANGTAKTVEFFLSKGAKPDTPANSKDDYCHNGWRPLHFLGSRYAGSGSGPHDVEIATLLIRNGANVNATNHNGETPLHTVKGAAVIRLLLDHGAAVNVWDHGLLKRTPLHYFALLGDLECVKVLLEHEAQRDALDGSGETPLDVAVFFGNEEVVEFLLQKGAKPTQHTLDQAIRANDAKVIQLIKHRLFPDSIRPLHRR